MAWQDELLDATFRGIPFFVEVGELVTGRRTVDHETAYSEDEQFVEDMGRKGRAFPVEAYLVGDDYLLAKERLLKALETKGPGELVHPYYGTRLVQVGTVRVRENAKEGGTCQLSIEFKATRSKSPAPKSVADGAANVKTSAASAKAAIGSEFLAKFQVLAGYVDSVSGALQSAAAAVDKVTSTVSLGTQALAKLKRSVAGVESSASALAAAPSQLLAQTTALVEALGEALIAASPHNVIGAMLKLYDFSPGVRPPTTTPNREIEQTNFDATQLLFQRLVLVQAATMAIEQTFASYDDAVAARATITDLIDEQAEIAADDTYPALDQLRADLVSAVPGEANDLPKLVEYTPHATMPSLVVAYDLYGNLSKEADLLARNTIRHAGFITGGVTLEVLSSPDQDTEPLTDG